MLAYAGAAPRLIAHYLKEDRRDEHARREPAAVRAELRDAFDRMRDGQFAPRQKSRQCRLCPVRFACAKRVN